MSTTAVQPDDSSLSTSVPLFSNLSLTSTSATSSSASSFTVSATISNNGGAAVSAAGFKIGTTAVYANATDVPKSVGSGASTYTHTKTDAALNTLFYVWAFATNSVGVNIQGPIQVTTPALGLFQVSDWTGSISVNHSGTVTTVAGNSPQVLYAGTVAANSSNTNTVSVPLGRSDGTVTTYGTASNTIRIQIPTSGFSNSASTDYLYTAVRNVIQPAAPALVTYTVAVNAIPTGFSIAEDAVFTQGTIQQGDSLNSVKLGSNALTNNASTNITTVTVATLRTLTLNITPGSTFTNSGAADFTYNIVQPSVQPTLTTGSIPTQSTEITGSADIDLRSYFTNGKFFEITSNSATASKISATIVNGYILRLTGQGSCNDITGTTSAGSIVVAAFNEKATVDGSVAGSTASAITVEKGNASVSATVALNVTACNQNATLTMTFVSGSSTFDGCTVEGISSSGQGNVSKTHTYAVSDIGSTFTNQMQFTVSKSGENLSPDMIVVGAGGSGFTVVKTDNGNTVTIGFTGTNPNQNVNGNMNSSFTVNITRAAQYVSAIQLNMINVGYTVSGNGILSLSGAASNSLADMDSKTITASSGTFTADPEVFYSDQTPNTTNYIHVTSHTADSPFQITKPSANGTSSFSITGKTKILSSDTSGSANVVMVPNTGTPSAVTGIKIHGVSIQSGGTGTHYSVNRNTANTSIPFDIVGTGNIGVTISNASVSGSSVTLNSPSTSTSGSFSGTCSIGTAAQNGSFTLTATPTGGTAYSITVDVKRITDDGTSGIIGYYYSGPHSGPSTYPVPSDELESDGYPAICDIAVGSSNSIYSKTLGRNIGDVYYTTPEAAHTQGTQQGSVFDGNDKYYRTQRTYFWTGSNSYINLGSQTFYIQFGSNGAIKWPGQVSCGLSHP